MIYLDHAATTPPLPCALEAYRTAPFGNPSSAHAAGQAARAALEQAREKIAECIGADPSEIYFTSGTTEACALALSSIKWAGKAITASPYEHHAVLAYTFTLPPLILDLFPKAYAQMLANNETGEIFPMPRRGNSDTLIFTDATAAMGHIPIDVKALDVDYLAAGAHKFGGIPGVGFLYARKGSPLLPVIRGGGQERGMRGGTENLPAICAMAAALVWQTEHMEENVSIAYLRNSIYDMLADQTDGVLLNRRDEYSVLPHILNVSFPGVDAHALALILSEDGVMVSPGAACSNGLNEPSHVILAMYGDEVRARSAIRISLSHENTPDECAQAARKIAEAVAHLRSLTA